MIAKILSELGDSDELINYEQAQALETHIIQVIAPIIEGSSDTKHCLLAKVI